MSMKRLTLCVAVATTITLALFLMMESLVSMGKGSIDKPPKASPIEFIRLNKQSELSLKQRELPEKPPSEVPPSRPLVTSLEADINNPETRMALKVTRPGLKSQLGLQGGLSFGELPMDRDTVPIVRVEPMYPSRAAQRRIEGWVVVEFTIGKQGRVENAKVVRSQPGTIFNRSALKAVSKWKYKPRVDNGLVVETHGHQTKITFKLND